MVKYTLIIEYLSKGNNFSQIATLCSCSRTTVWRVLQCIDFLSISLDEIKEMKKEELRFLLFPERIKKGNGYSELSETCVYARRTERVHDRQHQTTENERERSSQKRLKSTIFYNKTLERQSFLQKSGCLFSYFFSIWNKKTP